MRLLRGLAVAAILALSVPAAAHSPKAEPNVIVETTRPGSTVIVESTRPTEGSKWAEMWWWLVWLYAHMS